MACPPLDVLCIDDESLLRAYLTDASPLRGNLPQAVLFPSDAAEVAKVIRWANKEKVAVYPYGGGSSLVGSPLPFDGIVVDTSLLLDLEVFEKDKLVLAGAGWRLSELNHVLRRYGLWFPVDPGSVEWATVGGVVATNAGGIRAVKYGLTSDHVRALEFVTPVGEVVWSGAWAKKSSTWLRVHQLLVGSEGTLGIVTKALLTLSRVPERREAVLLLFEEAEEMGEAVLDILELAPSALEFMDPKTVRAVNSRTDMSLKMPEKYLLLVEFDDERSSEKTKLILDKYEGIKEDPETLWKYRKLAGPSLTLVKGSRSDWDVAVPVSLLPEAIKFVYENARDWEVAVFGHAGDGNLHVNLLHPPGEEWVRKAIEKPRRSSAK